MAQRSEIDRRAKHYAPRQCLSDHGMHKDAESERITTEALDIAQFGRVLHERPPKVVYRARPGKRTYRARTLKDDLIALRGGER